MTEHKLRYSNNVYGEKLKDCYYGQYNVTFEDGQYYVNIYHNNELKIKILAYKNPYHIAMGVLSFRNVDHQVKQINNLRKQGYIEGTDFTITEGGVYLKSHVLNQK